MKKIIFLFLVSSILIAQEEKPKSTIELKFDAGTQTETGSFSNPSITTEYLFTSIQTQRNNKKKNPGLAIIYSFILPGMGELYAEGFHSGKYFTIADGILWGTLIGFNTYAGWKEDNYKTMAQSKAGINPDGKESGFFANVGQYLSVDDYNKAKELNRDFDLVYNTTTHYWRWASNDERKEYRNLWSSSEQAYNNVRFVVGALVLNRLISVINAVRLTAAYNKNIDEELSWNVYIGINNNIPSIPSQLSINFITKF